MVNCNKFEIKTTHFTDKFMFRRLVVGFLWMIPMAICFFTGCGQKQESNNVPLNPIKTTDSKRSDEYKTILNQINAIPKIQKPQNKTENEILSMLEFFLEEANAFYDSYQSYTTFVSYNGFLYDAGIQKYIESKDLRTSSEITKEEAMECLILYVKQKDICGLYQKTTAAEDFEVVVVCESPKGLLMASKAFGTTQLGKEKYEALMQLYKTDVSIVGTVYPKDQEYGEILKILKEYTNAEKGLDIRTLTKSDLYALVVLSPKEEATNLQQYVLKKVEGKWSVVVAHIEKERNPALAINQKDVNFNILMLPNYSIYLYRDEMKTEFTSLTEAMIQAGYTTKADGQPTFQSGTGGFVYLEFETEKKFVGHRTEEGLWVLYPVQTYEEAVIMMLSLNETPPLFILKQSEYR